MLLDKNKQHVYAANRSLNLTMAVTTFTALGSGILVAVSVEIVGATRSVLVRQKPLQQER